MLHTLSFRVTEIDKLQRATLVSLKDGAVPLKKKVPYDQLLPYTTSELHNSTSPPADDDTLPPADTSPPADECTSPSANDNPLLSPDNNTLPPAEESTSSPADESTSPVPPADDGTSPPPNDNTLPPPNDNTSLPTNDNTSPPPNDNTSLPPNENTSPPADNNTSPPPDEDTLPPPSFKHQKNPNNKKRSRKPKQILYSHANTKPDKLVPTILQDDYWLNDEHIDHAQWLTSKMFPHAKGLHSVLAFESRKPKVERGLEDFVQVILIGRNHWVTITNIGCESNKVKVYDSLYYLYAKLPESDRQKFHTSLASLLNTSLANMVIEWPSMVQQKGCSDCGLFALAVAVSLCNDDDPGLQAYDQRALRVHLALCFQCDEITSFPVKPSRHVVEVSAEETVDLFCHCRIPYSDGVFMVECSGCFNWFHRSCEKVPKTVTSKTSFYCKNCK